MKSKNSQSNIQPVISVLSNENEKINVFQIDQKDGWSICDFVCANENRLQLYFPITLEANLTPDLAKRFADIKYKEFEDKEEFLFTVKPENSRKVIGLVYIKELDWETGQGEFAYCIDYNYEGKGIASNIVDSLSNYAFESLQLKTLQIIVHETNLASIGVAKKCNFAWIKTLPEEYAPRGNKPMDMELYERYKK